MKHGVILLDKSSGLSSNQALQQVKHKFKTKKAGHTGSLDPLATGMLPICLGEATKFSQFLLNADKQYEVTAKLGVCTTTGDSEGEVLAEYSLPVLDIKTVETVLENFIGSQQQLPPMYSALKHNGKPLYQYARQGVTIERELRPITLYSIKLLALSDDNISLQVHCSKGTYIRTLVEDIAKALNCGGAHVTALRRTRIGNWQSKQMQTLEALQETSLLPIETCVMHLPIATITDLQAEFLWQGQAVTLCADRPEPGLARIVAPLGFVGIGLCHANGQCQPKRLIRRSVK